MSTNARASTTAPASLSPAQLDAWLRFLQVNTDARRAITRDVGETSDLSEADYAILMHLQRENACIRSSALAEAIEWAPSRLSHQLKRLESRGLIRRSADDTDRRATFVMISDAGRAAISAGEPEFFASVASWFFEPLDDHDVAELTRILETIRRHVKHRSDTVSDEACPCVEHDSAAPTSQTSKES